MWYIRVGLIWLPGFAAVKTCVTPLQADAYALSQGLTLVGYYHANQCIKDVELGALGKKIAERIQSHTPQACALLVGAAFPAHRIPPPLPFCLALCFH